MGQNGRNVPVKLAILYVQFERLGPHQHQIPPFGFPLGFARGFGKTRQALSFRGAEGQGGGPAAGRRKGWAMPP
jgi:hypothetical protein